MKRIKVSTEEKNQILESHNKYRDVLMGHLFDTSLVSEQQTEPQLSKSGAAFLKDAQQKCNPNSPVAQGQPAKHQGKDVIKYTPSDEKKDSSGRTIWKQGDVVVIYPDGTYITIVTEGGRSAVRYTGIWNCPNLTFPQDRQNNLINTLIKDFGYSYFDQLPAADQAAASMQGQQQYDVLMIDNIKLLKPKTKIVGPSTNAETEIINSYLASSYGIDAPEGEGTLWKIQVTPEERQTFYKITIPKSAGLTRNFDIYLDISKLPVRLQNKFMKSKEKELGKLFNERNCGDTIVNYYNTWKNNNPFPFETLEQQKAKVRQCLARDYKYGTLGIGGGNVEKSILALKGLYTGDRKFPPMPQSGKDDIRPVVRKDTTPDGEKVLQFDFRLNR